MASAKHTYGSFYSDAENCPVDESGTAHHGDDNDSVQSEAPSRRKQLPYGRISLLSVIIALVMIVAVSFSPSKTSIGTSDGNIIQNAALELGNSSAQSSSKVNKKSWEVYKYTVAGSSHKNWLKAVRYFLADNAEEINIGCDGRKMNGDLGDIQLHYVFSNELEEAEHGLKVSYWESKAQIALGDMSSFHSFMNNKIQILVPSDTLAAIDKKVQSSSDKFSFLQTMRRLSYYKTQTVAHLILNIESHLYELVATASDDLDLTQYQEWAESECVIANTLNFDPDKLVTNLDADGLFEAIADGGYTTGYWTSISINTALEGGDLSALEDLSSDTVGLTVATTTSDYCAVTELSHFQSGDIHLLAPYRRVQYVRMLDTDTGTGTASDSGTSSGGSSSDGDSDGGDIGLTLTADWEEAVSAVHGSLHANATQYWGSGWDHWLDRHIGLVYSPGGFPATYDKGYTKFVDIMNMLQHEQKRGVGLRLLENQAAKFYTGYTGVVAWEYKFDFEPLGWNQNICTCNEANNELVYELEHWGRPCDISD